MLPVPEIKNKVALQGSAVTMDRSVSGEKHKESKMLVTMVTTLL